MRRTLPTALSAHDAVKRTSNPAGWHYHLSLLIYFVRKTIYLNFFWVILNFIFGFAVFYVNFFSFPSSAPLHSARRSFCAAISVLENIQIHTHTRTRKNINNKTNNGPLKSRNYLKYMSIALVLLLFRSSMPPQTVLLWLRLLLPIPLPHHHRSLFSFVCRIYCWFLATLARACVWWIFRKRNWAWIHDVRCEAVRTRWNHWKGQIFKWLLPFHLARPRALPSVRSLSPVNGSFSRRSSLLWLIRMRRTETSERQRTENRFYRFRHFYNVSWWIRNHTRYCTISWGRHKWNAQIE